MATLDAVPRLRWASSPKSTSLASMECADTEDRETLPPISHLDLQAINSDHNDHSRFPTANGLSISTAPLTSPTATMYSGPPVPYSCAPSASGSGSGPSGYISPPESTTRRSTRDERESPGLRKSLPSIHEALGDRSLSLPGPLSASSQHQPLPTPSTAGGSSFPDGPKGPVNPFSQPTAAPPVLRDVFPPHQNGSGPVEAQSGKSVFSAATGADPRQPVSQHFGYPGSPRSNAAPSFRSSALANTSFTNHNEPPPARSPQIYEQSRQPYPFPQFGNSNAPSYAPAPEPFQFSAGSKPDDQRGPYVKAPNDIQYSEAVKRQFEVLDSELGFNEVRFPPPF